MNEQITMDGQYTYRNGEPARVLCVDAPGHWPVRSMDTVGRVYFHGANGEQIDIHSPTLVPIEPFKRGEVVMVRDHASDDFCVRVFKSTGENGCYYTFETASTSVPWSQCRRPKPGELKEQS